MKKLPNAVKWLIIVAVLAAMAAMTFAVNDRASRVDMPAPANKFDLYMIGRAPCRTRGELSGCCATINTKRL